jgi:hypothetical protein
MSTILSGSNCIIYSDYVQRMSVTQNPESEEDRSNYETLVKTYATIPYKHTKIIHFIRHGQGYHNVAGEVQYKSYKSEEWFDAHLTQEGWKQATQLHAHLRAVNLCPDLVIVSPLMRALETAVAVFGRNQALKTYL